MGRVHLEKYVFRVVFSIITDNPGVGALGTEGRYRESVCDEELAKG